MHTPTVIRAFKRHYHKVGEIAEVLASKGPFNLHIKADESTLQAEFKTPDHEGTVRFVVLMRRFLGPSDALYYRKVWELLLGEFADDIPAEMVQRIDALIGRLNRGDIGININGENLTAERIYQILADGEYFAYNEDAQKYLRNLAGIPVVGPLVWQQFHAYTLNGYGLASALFDVVAVIEKGQKYQALYGDAAPKKTQCIYCLTTTANFTSEEHIFPESLGNDELVLPKGYVCDKCNNEVLAGLDNALLKFEPIAMLQVQFVPYTKDGKLPSANFQNLSMKRTSPRNITIKAKDKTARIRNKKDLGDGWVSFSINMKGSRFKPKVLGRALYKIALGMVALSQGHEKACDAKYDLARDFIRRGQGFPNNLIMKTECKPHPQVRVAYHDLSEGTPFAIDIYGLVFLLNLESAPVLQLNEVINQTQFALHPLRG